VSHFTKRRPVLVGVAVLTLPLRIIIYSENPAKSILKIRIEWVRSRAVHNALERFGGPKLRFVIEDLLEGNVMDDEITIENADAKNMADRLCREEGLFCGMSSGANVCAAIQMARTMDKGSKIVTVVVDRRDRYFAEYPNEHYVV